MFSLVAISLLNAAFSFAAAVIKKMTKQQKRKFAMTDYFHLARSGTVARKYLTPEIYCKLRYKATANGFSLEDLLTSGGEDFIHLNDVEFQYLVIVKDAESYTMFQPLLTPMLYGMHSNRILSHLPQRQDVEEMAHKNVLQDGQINDKRVLSCTLSANRNLNGFGFPLYCSTDEREVVGKIILEGLENMRDIPGYASAVDVVDQLGHLDKLGLQEDVSSIKLPINSVSNTKQQWIWWTPDRKCKVYINFRDHVAVVASQRGGDIQATFEIYSKLLQCLEKNLRTLKQEFLVSKKYGFLTTLLQDVGSGLRVEVEVKLPCLGKDSRFRRIVTTLPVTCIPGVDASDKDVFVVSNKIKMNYSEVEILQQVIRSLVLLLEIDKRIDRGENVHDILP